MVMFSNLESKRIIFAGTPDFAAVHLKALLEAGIRPIAVYTQPDRPAGRGHKLCPSEVKKLALEANIDVFTPENFKHEDDVKNFESLEADLCIVVAYGIILPPRVLDAPKLGCINVHGSLLPKYRGAAPIQRALLDGLDETGISIMKVGVELDAGDVYTTATTKITDDDTSESLFNRLADLGAAALVEFLPILFSGKSQAVPQNPEEVTYAKKISKDEAPLNFNCKAETVSRKIRGLYPWPVATTMLDNVRYKVFSAKVENKDSTLPPGSIIGCDKEGISVACAQGSIKLITIQAPGKGQVSAADLARSRKETFSVGKKFD